MINLEGLSSPRSSLETLQSQNEKLLIEASLKELEDVSLHRPLIASRATQWIDDVRQTPLQAFNIQRFLQAFPLTQKEGRSLMALAEAYLRIPDRYTAKLLLKDRLEDHTWSSSSDDKVIEMSRRGLDLINYVQSKSWGSYFEGLTLKTFQTFMRFMSREFILGQTIEDAVKRSLKFQDDRFSFDMLGEGARTYSMAKAFKEAYGHAIEVLGDQKKEGLTFFEKNSISLKLSALHPHYNVAHHAQVMDELLPILVELCVKAKHADIALTIDAEEASRLELSLDLIEKVLMSKELKGWTGFGLAVQAYQKRSLAVVEWAKELSYACEAPIMVRLVKGAYWDTEIKIAQVGGYPDYPVYTRKAATDLSYLACAKELLKWSGALYPQFATHNAFTVSAILEMAKGRTDIEFQRLQGMGVELYKAVRKEYPVKCRVYAPVGDDKDLLAYLVRRLLENGANSSFVHKIYDKSTPPQEILGDPWSFFEAHDPAKNPKIPLPKDLYGPERKNSRGCDLSDKATLLDLAKTVIAKKGEAPTRNDDLIDLEKALKTASKHAEEWDLTPVEKRGEILKRAAQILEEKRGLFLNLLIEEGKKTLPDAVSELREAQDFCQYYAAESLKHFAAPRDLQGPTGELNQLILRGRGVFACISPWNFPLAIFMGQVTAALASGNAVIAKPASLTPQIANVAVEVLYEAGVSKEILHIIQGPSSVIGAPLVADPRISGVVFTGSTGAAQQINRILAERPGPIIPFIAETGGINAMIVDSSALIEQVVDDVISSAFQSAGQRCSALRLLIIQEDIYEPTLAMLQEAMEALHVGDPSNLSTDVGPVIDKAAYGDIEAYIKKHKSFARTKLGKLKGNYVAPTIIEVKHISDVKREVFGPLLHVTRYKGDKLEQTIQELNQLGYGLTMGVQSRIERSVNFVRKQGAAGNLYVNRNIIGAVVGVQPFGGEGLSGTGPKAGGPYYLPRFAVERTFSYNIMASGGNISLLNLEE